MRNAAYDKISSLEEKLEHFCAQNPGRKAAAQRILDFIRSTPDCFERSHAAGHITGSAWLLNPGGHADGQSDTLAVALREAEEESGIRGITAVSGDIFDVDVHLIPARPGEAAHYHYDIRYLLRAPHEQFVVSDESDALEWWSAADFAERREQTDEAVLRMAAIVPGIKN